MRKFNKKYKSKYVDLEINGKLFPSWVVKNYKKFQLPPIILSAGKDPCNNTEEKKISAQKQELRKYQQFIGEYLNPESPYNSILVYHGLGSGKTASTINMYNVLYNSSPEWHMYVLLKSALRESWMMELSKFVRKDDSRIKNVTFINYDSPNAMKTFEERKKNSEALRKSMFVIEESHNFINAVYGNVKKGKKSNALMIYEAIIQEQKEKPETKIVLLSGTPMINIPFELALTFNLLRPGSFPTNEDEFNHIFVKKDEYSALNQNAKNQFQRRILGLVSYYHGSTPDYFAKTNIHRVNVKMSPYQYAGYLKTEELENTISLNAYKRGSKSTLYKTYTRQSSNFVFPIIDGKVIDRVRPGDFRLSEREIEKLLEGKPQKEKLNSSLIRDQSAYMFKLKSMLTDLRNHFKKISSMDEKINHTIYDDMNSFLESKISFLDFRNGDKKKSDLFLELVNCSAKFVNIIFNAIRSPGPGIIYSNYVKMEGLEIFKIYLEMFGFNKFSGKNTVDKSFVEFHGEIDVKERYAGMAAISSKDNTTGDKVKLILISAAGVEGLNLRNIRHVHIVDPYWNETRTIQVIGRAVRLCSHADLPVEDRIVDVYRYRSMPPDKKSKNMTVDAYIEKVAKTKNENENSFLEAMKEAAIDCVLFKNHNMITQKYKCFQFSDQSLFEKYVGPAYRKNIQQDMMTDNGSNSTKYKTLKMKVKKIFAVKQITFDPPRYSAKEKYWYNKKYNIVYDFDLHYPVGKLKLNDQQLPEIYKENIFIIDKVIAIPSIDN